ncbi:MAG TPA: hypothetical protein VK589_30240 [Chryseolinea sp.]|nr:hypothetical protein [Chryseolinea sp.]
MKLIRSKFCSSLVLILLALNAMWMYAHAQTKMASGDHPQVSRDKNNVVRVVYGETDKIYYSFSTNNGKTFSQPTLIGAIEGMHLGMSRGPQLATSGDYSLVTAMDKKGNIHAYQFSNKKGHWEKIANVNDSDGYAPEGLMSIAAGGNNTFYAVWLDLRESKQNNICVSILKPGAGWTKNNFVYKSPDGHVCECCKPSIVVKGDQVCIMFRNWVRGSRDLYVTNSLDNGESFSEAQKLGNGTWMLNACPMDGGGVSIDENSFIHTAWQRDGQVFYATPGKAEVNIGRGRGVGLNRSLVYWVDETDLMIKTIDGEAKRVALEPH